MATFRQGGLARWFIVVVLAGQALSLPALSKDEKSVKEIFSGTKRDVSPVGGMATLSLLKSPMFNPYFGYPVVPGKPIFYPPFLSPADVLLNRFAKSSPAGTTTSPAADPSVPASASAAAVDPSLISSYFKAKKDEFLTKLFQTLANATAPVSGISARSAPLAGDEESASATPTVDSSYFLKKKYEFIETLLKSLNMTAPPSSGNSTGSSTPEATAVTPKPTIVPPDFWFPFAKLPKTPKPPKPTKPPKAKKVLKDALDTILLQSLLLDLGVDPKEASLSKRAVVGPGGPKKMKSKKVKPVDDDPEEFYFSPKVDPKVYAAKASDCLDKLFKILNKTAAETEADSFAKSKTTPAPVEFWAQPSDTDYASKLDMFLDLLIRSLNATETPTGKPEKSKGKPGKKVKRATFLDELLHRVTTPSPTTTTTDEPEPTLPSQGPESDLDAIRDFAKECCCNSKCLELFDTPGKSTRSLIFRPFGSGYWVPQYLYAAKMGMYLDKLMESINAAAANDVVGDGSDMSKRSLTSPTTGDDDVSGLSPKGVAVNLLIAELTELKNNLVDAFAEGIKAQKDAATTPKPYGPPGKSFKKPFWGGKTAAPTVDPVAPIQKRIDILNDVFDKLTKVEKTLIFTSEPEYDPKLIANLTEILDSTTAKSKAKKQKFSPTKLTEDTDSPSYFLTKTKEYLQTLYANGKSDEK